MHLIVSESPLRLNHEFGIAFGSGHPTAASEIDPSHTRLQTNHTPGYRPITHLARDSTHLAADKSHTWLKNNHTFGYTIITQLATNRSYSWPEINQTPAYQYLESCLKRSLAATVTTET